MNFIDVDLQKTDDGYYDIAFGDDGDFVKTEGFDTAIKMSLMCERRADASEIPSAEYRRGWLGNVQLGFDNFQVGSKLWLLSQARADQDTLNNSVTYTQECLQWMIDTSLIDKIDVFAEYRNDSLILKINFIRFQNIVLSKYYDVWNNTFIEGIG